MKNKILSALLAVLMVMTVVPFATVPVSAAVGVQTVGGHKLVPSDGRFESLWNPDSAAGNWTVYGYTIEADEFDGKQVAKIYANGEEFQGIAKNDSTNIKAWNDGMPANLYDYGPVLDDAGNIVLAANANYITVEYYYDTTGRVDEAEEDRESLENKGMIWNQFSLTSGKSVWEDKPSSNTMVANQWGEIVIPVNYGASASGADDGLNQFAFYPLGAYNPGKMYTGDALYISEVRFTAYDPDSFVAQERNIYYYASQDDFDFGATYAEDTAEDLSKITLIDLEDDSYIPADSVFVGWKEVSTGTVYKAGDEYTLTSGADVEFLAQFKSAIAPSTVYFSADGVVDGVTDEVYMYLAEAVAAVADGGTIIVDGELAWTAGDIDVSSKSALTIEGYDDNASFKMLAYNTGFVGNNTALTLDNIKIVRADSDEGEAHLYIKNGTLTLGQGVTYQAGALTADWNLGATLHPNVGLVDAIAADQAYIFNSEDFTVDYMAPVVGYTAADMTATGDFYAEINAGSFNNIYSIARNGHTGIRTLDGNATFVINGGTIGNIYTGASRFGKITGDVNITINGGNIGYVYLGNAQAHETKNQAGNTYVVVNVDEILAGGFTVPEIVDGTEITNRGNNVVVINGIDKYDGEIAAPATATQFVKVTGGKLIPNSDGTFTAVADDPAKATVLANGTVVTADADGNYTLPAGTVNVVFGEEIASTLVTVTFDGVNAANYMSGAQIVLPAGEEGKIFAGWEYNDEYYNANASFTVPYEVDAIDFTGVYADITDGKLDVYVDKVNGSDTNSGLIAELPVQTMTAIGTLYDTYSEDASIVANIIGVYTGDTDPAYWGVILKLPAKAGITYTGGTLAYDEAMVVNGANTRFENITIKALQDSKFIEIGAKNVTFGDDVVMAEDSHPVSIHFGPSGVYSQHLITESLGYNSLAIYSGDFGTIYVGPNYIANDSAIDTFRVDSLYVAIYGGSVSTIGIGDGYGNNAKKYAIDGSINVELYGDAKLGSFSSNSRYCTSAGLCKVTNYSVNPVKYSVMPDHPDCAETYILNKGLIGTSLDTLSVPEVKYSAPFYAIDGEGALYNSVENAITLPVNGAYTFYKGVSVADALTIDGVSIRTEGIQGLRFIANYDFSIDETYEVEEFGFVVLPTTILAGNELKANTTYTYGGNEYDSELVPAARLYEKPNEFSKRYSVCIIGIDEAKYSRDYTVRTYIKVGGEYIYGAQSNTNVLYMAQKALDEHEAGTTLLDEATLATMKNILGSEDNPEVAE